VLSRIRSLPTPMMEDNASVIGGPHGETAKFTVFTLPRAQGRVFGLVSDVEALNSTFATVDTSAPLIVPALTGGVALDSIGSVVIRGAHGTPLYKSPGQYAPSITPPHTTRKTEAELTVEDSLRPE